MVFTNHWSDEYMYADIEAQWNGEELEYIALNLVLWTVYFIVN